MFPDFPLYTQLKNNTLKDSLILMTEDDRNTIFKRMKGVSEDEQKIIYALIRAYYIDSNKENIGDSLLIIDKLPYGCKNQKSSLRFDVDLLPTHLQYILLSFLKINKD
jgi:hypothetical protein